jgi:PPOX class probable F420-dependent enzyme
MEGFLQASLSGDMEALLELFSDDVTLYSDGGGKTRAALRPVYGADNVARFLTGILRNILPGFAVKQTRVNGRSGLVGYFGDGSPHSVAVNIAVEENRAYFRTWDTAWKLRRIHNNPEVHFAPSTARGKPTAPTDKSPRQGARCAERLLASKYPALHGLLVPLVHRLRGNKTMHVELTPAGTSSQPTSAPCGSHRRAGLPRRSASRSRRCV